MALACDRPGRVTAAAGPPGRALLRTFGGTGPAERLGAVMVPFNGLPVPVASHGDDDDGVAYLSDTRARRWRARRDTCRSMLAPPVSAQSAFAL
jgi:hypothetical protein